MNKQEGQEFAMDGTQTSRLRDMLHEVGNKIHVIAGRANRLRNMLAENQTAQHNLSIILEQSERAAQVLEDVRHLLISNETDGRQEEGER